MKTRGTRTLECSINWRIEGFIMMAALIMEKKKSKIDFFPKLTTKNRIPEKYFPGKKIPKRKDPETPF